jgi:DNA repair protein RecO (recombination protein O)
MGVVSTEGLVLRYADYKEADRIVVLLTPDLGKLTVSARGARKPRSRLLAGAQLFCHADYQLFRLNEAYTMSQVDLKESFFNIRNDINKFAYAAYMMNLTEEAVSPDERAQKLYHLVLDALTFLAYSEINAQDIIHAFEIKLIDILGYRPVLKNCSLCGGSCNNKTGFSIADGGLVCENCRSNSHTKQFIHMSTIKTLSHMLQMDIRRLNVLKVSERVRSELEEILPACLEYVFDKRMKARKLIEFNKSVEH